MGRRDDRDDRPSWRDIDRKRDRSSHTEQHKPMGGSGGGQGTSSRYYKAALDKAMKSKLEAVFADPERDGRARSIRDATTGAERTEATAAYLDQYGVPEDFETLMAMAEVKDDGVFAQVVPPMAEQWDAQSAPRRKLATQMLQLRLMRVRDKEARQVAMEMIRKG
ncbi:MAG: hypothetical protein QGH45_00820 [Myxococcota bacterium]|jgi:hypothetical protein|nr:hypothetical protein [Myxococcota bacterium]